jgi:hypothetical protein
MIENLFEPFLQNLDPSLFQSVIVGLLMILIFVGEQIFSEVKSQKGRGEFSKMVIFYEILNIVYIPIFATIALIFFAFFKDDLNGHSINVDIKILTLFFLIIFVFVFLQPIFKFQRFFRGKRHKLEISFLKHLSFSKILKFRNTAKAEKMVRAWNSFWSEKSEFNEREFTRTFISHIDDAVKYRKLELAIELSQTYVNNIEKRDRFSIGYEVLPKVFEWNEMFWGGERLWLKSYDTEKRIQNFISQKYFPTFRTWALNIYNKTNSKRDNFWNWHYFGGEFFQAIIKALLKDGHSQYQLFTSFKKHIEESEKRLDKIEDEKEKEKYWNYVTGLFASFCPTFFNEIDSTPSNYGIWEHDFPLEWKISMANIKNRIPRVILHEFLQWSRDRIFKKDNTDSFDKDLTEVINGIFPNVHSSLFTSFLMLFSSSEIKYALEKEPNFYILGVSVSWSGSVEESEEDRDKRLAEMMREKDISQKEETIQIILNFFHFWQTLTLYKDNLSDDESKKWESFTEAERKSIVKKVRKEKLEKIKVEIESDEIKNVCNNSERKELYRKHFLELVELLLSEIEK